MCTLEIKCLVKRDVVRVKLGMSVCRSSALCRLQAGAEFGCGAWLGPHCSLVAVLRSGLPLSLPVSQLAPEGRPPCTQPGEEQQLRKLRHHWMSWSPCVRVCTRTCVPSFPARSWYVLDKATLSPGSVSVWNMAPSPCPAVLVLSLIPSTPLNIRNDLLLNNEFTVNTA